MTNNDLWCKECKSQHHPIDECYSQGKDKEQKTEQTIEEKVGRILTDFLNILAGEYKQKRQRTINQIISLVRADERERIFGEIEKIKRIRLFGKYKWESDDVFKMLDDIRKLLRPESDTKGK